MIVVEELALWLRRKYVVRMELHLIFWHNFDFCFDILYGTLAFRSRRQGIIFAKTSLKGVV